MTWTNEIPANPVVAIAGATGAVGREFLEVLHDLDFPASEVCALASSRSAGLDSLFTPSTGSEKASTESISAISYSSSLGAPSGNASNSSTEVISGGGTSNSSLGTGGSFSSREITLLQPVSYEDVASVARSVKLGNIVVLSLRSTDSALAKRVLDFSFGVASALDARVDCVADKTFIVVQGGDLSLEERHRLQKQGIL